MPVAQPNRTVAQAEAAVGDPCLLIADDQPHILETLAFLLKPEGYHLETARTPGEALAAMAPGRFDGLLMDLNYSRDTTSGREGLELLAAVRAGDSRVPIVVMTAWANVDLAVEAMRCGANDFVQKPWDNLRLLTILRTQMALRRAQRRTEWLEAENRVLRTAKVPRSSSRARLPCDP